MGLGKTVQSVAALIIRNAMAAANDEPPKPTLICSPNTAVTQQWKLHLLKGGVAEEKIVDFVTRQTDPLPINNDIFYVCTRYDLQAEAKYIVKSLPNTRNKDTKAERKTSPIFPYVSDDLLRFFKKQYNYCKGSGSKGFKEMLAAKELKVDEAVASELAEAAAKAYRHPTVFKTLIIDEAHFMKNLGTYWSMAVGMVSFHSERVCLLTGTPFNNSLQDMASLMTYIDPAQTSAKIRWWKESTERGAALVVKRKLSQWANQYLVRREKDVIAEQLLPKTICKEKVVEKNLDCYEKYEKKFGSVVAWMEKYSGDEPTVESERARKQMLALMKSMQLSLVHPILPNQGRQLSILCSPSLCTNTTVKKRLEIPNRCVCCKRQTTLAAKKKKKRSLGLDSAAVDDDELDESDDEGAEDLFEEVSEDDGEGYRRMSNDVKGTGDIVAIPSGLCKFASRGIRHFACESCLAGIEESGGNCPMCVDLIGRCCGNDGKSADDNGVYCKDVFGGFRPSAKLEKMVSDFKTEVPAGDKGVIFSSSKGALDLIEAMFHRDRIEVARYDGDVNKKDRPLVLDNFKTSKTCQILLMTIQTGGVGLNITEANHVSFIDRDWNPMVLEQCEDRCWRYGQKKEVLVRFYDVRNTLDEVMGHSNETKSVNAGIILSDRLALSNQYASFKDITGFAGRAIGALQHARESNSTRSSEDILRTVAATMPDADVPGFVPLSAPTQSLGSSVVEYPPFTSGHRIGLLPRGEDWPCPYCTFVNRGGELSHPGGTRICAVCGQSSLAGCGPTTMAIKREEDVARTPLVSSNPPKRKIPDDAEIIEID